jgi:DNA modification methylase
LKNQTINGGGVSAAAPSRLCVVYKGVSELKPDPKNARRHSAKHIKQIGESIRRLGFNVPILIDRVGNVIAGHARLEAAKRLGMSEVPTICLDDLTEAQIAVFKLADNRLCEIGEWNDALLAEQLQGLLELNLDFDVDITGFEMPHIDRLVTSLSHPKEVPDPADELPEISKTLSVSKLGDVWILDKHRLICGDARDPQSFQELMNGELARLTITDPPFNVKIDGHASGRGATKHEEFLMASGEMSSEEFITFLSQALTLLAAHMQDGAFCYLFIDWGHVYELLVAGKKTFSEPKNLCVWTKDRAGLGSFYRSQHELIFLFKKGSAAHVNNIQLGRFGRNRSNVWSYPSPVSFGRSVDEGELLTLHPTVKPVALIADALLDCTRRGEVVLDAFLGSGTAIIAAERTGRACRGIELDPRYVDLAIRRWQALTGKSARHAGSGRTFAELEGEASNG